MRPIFNVEDETSSSSSHKGRTTNGTDTARADSVEICSKNDTPDDKFVVDSDAASDAELTPQVKQKLIDLIFQNNENIPPGISEFHLDPLDILGPIIGIDRLKKIAKLEPGFNQNCDTFGDKLSKVWGLRRFSKKRGKSADMTFKEFQKEHKWKGRMFLALGYLLMAAVLVVTAFGGVMFCVGCVSLILFLLTDASQAVASGDAFNIVRPIIWLVTSVPILAVIFNVNYYIYITLEDMFKGEEVASFVWDIVNGRLADKPWRQCKEIVVNGVILIVLPIIVLLMSVVACIEALVVGSVNVGLWFGLTGTFVVLIYVTFTCVYFPLRAWFVCIKRDSEYPKLFRVMDRFLLLHEKDKAESWLGFIRWLPNGYTSWRSFLFDMDDEMGGMCDLLFSGNFKICLYDAKFWVYVVFFVLNIIKIIFDIVYGCLDAADISAAGGSAAGGYIMTVVRFFLNIALMPFLVTYNPYMLVRRCFNFKSVYVRHQLMFGDNESAEDAHDIATNVLANVYNPSTSSEAMSRRTEPIIWTVIVVLLGFASIIAFIVIGAVMRGYLERDIIQSYTPPENVMYPEKYHSGSDIGSDFIEGWHISELAALTVLSSIDMSNQKLRENVTRSILPGVKITTLEGHITTGYVVETSDDHTTPAIVFTGIREDYSLACILDSITMYYSQEWLGYVLPLCSSIYDFTKTYLGTLTLGVYKFLISAHSVSQIVAADADTVLKKYVEKVKASGSTAKRITPIVVGHETGGLIAKYVSLAYGCKSFAFESPKIDGSLIYLAGAKGPGFLFDSNDDIDTADNFQKIHNYYSDRLFFLDGEESALVNIMFPTYETSKDQASPHETFCFISSGYASRRRYDEFCTAVMRSMYASYHLIWKKDLIGASEYGYSESNYFKQII